MKSATPERAAKAAELLPGQSNPARHLDTGFANLAASALPGLPHHES